MQQQSSATQTPLSHRGKLALLPLVTFLALFLGVGFYYQSQGVEFAFYQLPAPVAIIPAILLAFLLSRESLNHTIEEFVKGAGHPNIMTMCLIFLLAGGFSAVAKSTGAVDATVGLGLHLIPTQLLLPGLFLIAAFIATAMGTSMGTLAAMAPIGLGLAEGAGLDKALVAGALVSGAIFGDNLSIISDTTIAATRTQGCEMRDKFKANLKLALPAALIVVVLLAVNSSPTAPPPSELNNAWLVVPYLMILTMAVAGINVFVVLLSGIVVSLLMGSLVADYALANAGNDIYNGFKQMQEVFILAILLGGMSELMRRQGGLTYMVNRLSRWVQRLNVNKELGHSMGIAGLIALANICIANNTVSIIVTGEVAKELAEEGGISAPRAASLLDIFACVIQGIVPYGAQLLLVGATFSVSPIEVIPYAWYCFVLAAVAIGSFIWAAKNQRD